MPAPLRILSGGQTGADRGALDAAIELGLPHGGFCPRGRRAEDGRIPARYQLTELSTPDYPARTEANVLAADATLIVTRGAPTGGTALTLRLCRRHQRPHLHVDLDRAEDPAAEVRAFLTRTGARVLNVAGPRESTTPGIGSAVRELLRSIASGG